MPRARKGPGGPRRSAAGKSGTNKATPRGGAKGSKRSTSNMGGTGRALHRGRLF